MKALLYKEFKLAMHPVCYAFVFLFPLMILIPKFPTAVGFIYVLTTYPILFLGANKGQQSNDLLYSTLLPVRKKDIVLARVFTVMTLHVVFALLTLALLPLALLIRDAIPSNGGPSEVGLGLSGYVSTLGIVFLGFALADLIFFPIYYRHAKSIVASTLLTILGFVLYVGIFTIALPHLPGLEGYRDFLCSPNLGHQFIVLGIGLALYAVIHFLIYKISSKQLERVDF